ncbi:ATP-dependent DNA helicase RecG [Tessaracoccus sp. OH4464_COT-324]|uniref:ATP-dependent DNA helicase RecG n=1 Tax=Tessaracoccus sp. OH4464_COT-324 TaxID=2491059 RepID=UPI000F637275|nr:ATP-dependent DNA helicase RecG [Tessaracoccus sp. OH4464_COT-324]RRD46279.1 ATP-dependent DNA helicase RecG [Tessaracoccus sp. OH4464_COT-324]
MYRSAIYRELARKLPDVVGVPTAKELSRLGLETVDDLIRHVPRRYVSGGQMTELENIRVGDDVVVIATVRSTTIRSGTRMRVESVIADAAGTELVVTLFVPSSRRTGRPMENYATHWAGQLAAGARGIFVGRVGEFQGRLQLTHPDYVIVEGARITARKSDSVKERSKAALARLADRATMIGIYPATARMPTWLVAEAVQLVAPTIAEDPLPEWVLQEAGMPALSDALRAVHEPTDLQAAERGKERLRFDEAFGIQLAMAHKRAAAASAPAVARPRVLGGLLEVLDAQLPFELTPGQVSVGETIFTELARTRPMHRLLQGEVGSGKTLVALRAMLAVVDNGGQAVLVAPTEVLARQHHRAIRQLLGPLGEGRSLAHPGATDVVLLTGSLPAAHRRAALNSIITGEAGIVVGTHALFSDPVSFFDLGLVVIDEQHRFGVEQRAVLSAQGRAKPHTLVMTATPIPRSIAMTIFGDLEVSELRERPAGRAEVQTVFVNTSRHPAWVERAWQRAREEVAAGRQVFVVCPAIEPGESAGERQLTSVVELADRLGSGPLAGLRLGVVHGRQSADERARQMSRFADGETDVLVATTVIEVGVDVPNATMMIVHDADRFGISQLHQLRGRVGRGQHPGLALLLAPVGPDDVAAERRLAAVASTTDGFELAEADLAIRREGDVLGANQSGASSLKILRIADVEVIERAKELAERVLSDPRAADDPRLADLLEQARQVAAGEWLEKG